jgi:Flp pilus assembly protein TadD
MKKNVTLQIAASTLVLGLTVVGCKPAGSLYRPASASANVVTGEAAAAKVYEQARIAVQKADLASALGFAERAVELSPRDAGYRMLLADLYLKNGRFLSAEQAFTDVLTLDPGNNRATLSLALAQVAQGKSREAMERLDRVSSAAPADAGLAYALAGQPQRAIELLGEAARAPGATARVRQNLALSYAIAGDWQKARVIASQDLSPNDVASRLEQWASFANPTSAHLQVATLLGTSPVQDAGQPTRLALAPSAPEAPVFAEAPAAASAEAPVAVAETQAQTFAYSPPEHGDAFAAPAAIEAVDVPASASTPAKVVTGTQFAAAVTSLVNSPEPAVEPAASAARLASAPIRPFVPAKAEKKARSGQGRFVVQIGAYRSAAQVEKAWSRAIRHYRLGNEPMSTKVSIPGKGIFHRLAVSGFHTPAEAARACQSIRGKGGNCFVRANAGDAPVRWASRYHSYRA